MNLLDSVLLLERTLITCRAFFPNSEKSLHGIMCYKDGHPTVFVEISYEEWNNSITYDVWFYPNHSKTIYSVSYDRMCARLKELNRIL